MPDREKLKQLLDNIEENDGLDSVVNYLMENGGENLLENIENTGEDLLEQVKSKPNSIDIRYTNPTGSVPTLASQQLEESVKSTTPNALNTVMRAERGIDVNKNANFLNGLGFRIDDIGELELRKKLSQDKVATLYTDTFDKTLGLRYENNYTKRSKLNYSAEYDLRGSEGQFSVGYSDPSIRVQGNVYFGDNNGLNVSATKILSPNSNIAGSISLFESDAAFKLSYIKRLDNDNLSLGMYGSTAKKELGITCNIGF